ncbi:MAG: DNA translocase FtsK 4TM domain-containing protein [Proteobacteria bacterium]|nr:DNA translocase FtsK 4TM domain-containing protein [Pseudomonadota bacterium]MBU1057006.1 DNA translocase FtsK 4TM domain-containing protein [Pseudomonadota bacterium]
MAQVSKITRPGLKQEAAAVLGIFLSLFLFLSLISTNQTGEGNWGGELGKLVAQVLMGFTGWGAYLLASLLLLLSFLFFSPRMSFERLPQITAGLTGSVIAACALLSSLSLKGLSSIESGGFLGKTVFTLMQSVVGGPGAVLFLLLLFVISLMLSTQFSPYQLGALLWRMVKRLAIGSKNFLVSRNEKRALRKEVIKEGKEQARKEVLSVDKNRLQIASPAPSLSVPVVQELSQANKRADVDDEFAAQPVARGDWKIPPISLLDKNMDAQEKVDKEVYYQVSKQLEQKLKNFGVSGKVIGISPGPVVTTYEYAPAAGVKINKIVALADDLALGLKAQSVRVVGSVPGKAALGIEIPNPVRSVVYIRELLASELYRERKHKLDIALGLDVVGYPVFANLAKMPHLLIAGATGAGKSVAINTIIASLLFNATPEEVRLLMIDPKRIELSGYEGIPHLLHPVVVEPKLASRALMWAVREMERRYRLMEEQKVKSFDSYNEACEEKLPYIVIIVDELADLMMVASKDVESSIARLAQMARAAGMHLLLATQRPSVDVLTGLIKANFPTRISFKVSSKIDSRTILDTSGAEHLLGAGDMLYLANGSSSLQRIHGAYISEAETERIITFLKEQGNASYDDSVTAAVEEGENGGENGEDGDHDERYDEAVAIVCESGQASISMVQRRLRVGYNRAARMVETMEKEGVVGPADGAKPREVLTRNSYD